MSKSMKQKLVLQKKRLTKLITSRKTNKAKKREDKNH